jgi:hypothetical protein
MADVKERVQLYLYSQIVPSSQVIWGLSFPLYYLLFLYLLPQHFRQVEGSVTCEICTKLFNYKQHVGRMETTEYLTNCSTMAQERERERLCLES